MRLHCPNMQTQDSKFEFEAPHNIKSLGVSREKTFCFFETWMPERGSNPRSLTFKEGSFNYCTRAFASYEMSWHIPANNRRWVSVADGVPTFSRHCVNISCLLGTQFMPLCKAKGQYLNSCPGGLRPSTLPLGHGGSPQYRLSHVDGEETFFVSFKPPRLRTEPRTLAWKAAVLTTTLGPPPCLLVR